VLFRGARKMFALKGLKGQGFKYKFTLSPLVLRLDDLFSV
jgi:hypothetical protein